MNDNIRAEFFPGFLPGHDATDKMLAEIGRLRAERDDMLSALRVIATQKHDAIAERDEAINALRVIGERKDAAEARAGKLAAAIRNIHAVLPVWANDIGKANEPYDALVGAIKDAELLARLEAVIAKDVEK